MRINPIYIPHLQMPENENANAEKKKGLYEEDPYDIDIEIKKSDSEEMSSPTRYSCGSCNTCTCNTCACL